MEGLIKSFIRELDNTSLITKVLYIYISRFLLDLVLIDDDNVEFLFDQKPSSICDYLNSKGYFIGYDALFNEESVVNVLMFGNYRMSPFVLAFYRCDNRDDEPFTYDGDVFEGCWTRNAGGVKHIYISFENLYFNPYITFYAIAFMMFEIFN